VIIRSRRAAARLRHMQQPGCNRSGLRQNPLQLSRRNTRPGFNTRHNRRSRDAPLTSATVLCSTLQCSSVLTGARSQAWRRVDGPAVALLRQARERKRTVGTLQQRCKTSQSRCKMLRPHWRTAAAAISGFGDRMGAAMNERPIRACRRLRASLPQIERQRTRHTSTQARTDARRRAAGATRTTLTS
jgi:hypothetical protein